MGDPPGVGPGVGVRLGDLATGRPLPAGTAPLLQRPAPPPDGRAEASVALQAAPVEGEQRPWPGRPWPLGASWDGEGTNVALWASDAEGVELCLLDPDGVETRLPLEESTYQVWHGYLPQVRPAQRTAVQPGQAADRPVRPGHRRRADGARRDLRVRR